MLRNDPATGLEYPDISTADRKNLDNLPSFKCDDGFPVIYFFEPVQKTGGMNRAQKRMLIVTDGALWQCTPDTMEVNRCVPILDIDEVVFKEDNWIGIVSSRRYDLLLQLQSQGDIMRLIRVLKVLSRSVSGGQKELVVKRAPEKEALKDILSISKPKGYDPKSKEPPLPVKKITADDLKNQSDAQALQLSKLEQEAEVLRNELSREKTENASLKRWSMMLEQQLTISNESLNELRAAEAARDSDPGKVSDSEAVDGAPYRSRAYFKNKVDHLESELETVKERETLLMKKIDGLQRRVAAGGGDGGKGADVAGSVTTEEVQHLYDQLSAVRSDARKKQTRAFEEAEEFRRRHQKQVASLEAELATATERHAEKLSELQRHLEDKEATVLALHDDLRSVKTARDVSLRELQGQLSAAVSAKAVFEVDVAQLTEEIQSLKARLAKAHQDFDQQTSRLADAERDRTQLTSSLVSRERELDSLRSERDTASRHQQEDAVLAEKTRMLQEEVEKLREDRISEARQSTTSLEEAATRTQQLRNETDKAHLEVKSLQSLLGAERRQNAALESTLNNIKHENRILRRDEESLQSELNTLRSQQAMAESGTSVVSPARLRGQTMRVRREADGAAQTVVTGPIRGLTETWTNELGEVCVADVTCKGTQTRRLDSSMLRSGDGGTTPRSTTPSGSSAVGGGGQQYAGGGTSGSVISSTLMMTYELESLRKELESEKQLVANLRVQMYGEHSGTRERESSAAGAAGRYRDSASPGKPQDDVMSETASEPSDLRAKLKTASYHAQKLRGKLAHEEQLRREAEEQLAAAQRSVKEMTAREADAVLEAERGRLKEVAFDGHIGRLRDDYEAKIDRLRSYYEFKLAASSSPRRSASRSGTEHEKSGESGDVSALRKLDAQMMSVHNELVELDERAKAISEQRDLSIKQLSARLCTLDAKLSAALGGGTSASTRGDGQPRTEAESAEIDQLQAERNEAMEQLKAVEGQMVVFYREIAVRRDKLQETSKEIMTARAELLA